jgi:CheY-specific phosphatase CheX
MKDLGPTVSACITEAVTRVFSTMLNLEIENDVTTDDFAVPPFDFTGICGCVSFAGKMTGIVYFSMKISFSQQITKLIVGDSQGLGENEVNDVIGELTNMITGNLKSMMADKGYNCALSIPNIMSGEEIRVSGKGYDACVTKIFKVPELTEEFAVRTLVKLNV